MANTLACDMTKIYVRKVIYGTGPRLQWLADDSQIPLASATQKKRLPTYKPDNLGDGHTRDLFCSPHHEALSRSIHSKVRITMTALSRIRKPLLKFTFLNIKTTVYRWEGSSCFDFSLVSHFARKIFKELLTG